MKYSLIIPHHNDFKRLERLLLTIPVSRSDIEVIVVDDCSPNQMALKELQIGWPMVHWLSTSKNVGAGAARNLGLASARGEYLVFADSDDEFLPKAFELFDTHMRDKDDLVYFLAEAVHEADYQPSNRADRMNNLCKAYLDMPSKKRLEQLAMGHVVPWAKIYSRQFISRNEVVFENTWVSNDVAFNVLGAVQAKQVRVVKEPVYKVFRRKGSLTSGENIDKLIARVRVLGRLNVRLRELDAPVRMHAGSYLFKAFWKGPKAFLKVLREVFLSGLLAPTLRQFSIRDFFCFCLRYMRDQKERKRL